MVILPNPLQFEWDPGNLDKNWRKHRVSPEECEEVFFDAHKRLLKDALHSGQEVRHILLGRTQKNRILFLVFTVRKSKVRVISARDLNQREKKLL